MKNTWILDIEVYPNLFYIGIRDYRNKKKFDFQMSSWKDERLDAYNVLSKYNDFLVTFNGIYYDNIVIKYFLSEFNTLKKLSIDQFCIKLKEISNYAIADNYEVLKKYKWMKSNWIDIDLACYWAKSLRKNKSISLKSLGIQLNHPRVQELPVFHEKILSREEAQEVMDYCLNNDIDITEKLFEKMRPDIELRHYIKKEYGIECWSMDAPKIASEYLLKKFCEKTWDGTGTLEEYIREKRKYRYSDRAFKIGDYLPNVNFKTKIFQDLFEEIKNFTIIKPKYKKDPNARMFEKEFVYTHGKTNVLVSMGVGGIHILNKNEVYRQQKGFSIIDQDVQSLYPQLIENHGFLRKELEIVIKEYLALKTDRVAAKREGNKTKDTFLKLVLNSFTGIADSDVTWVYSPEQLIALRLYGQLIQLRVMEDLSEIGIQIISNNTDGTTAIVPDDKLNQYHKINNSISKEFNVIWEYAVIDKAFYSSVNGYIASVVEKYLVDKDGNKIDVKDYHKEPDIKRKGLFRYEKDIPLGDSVNEQVIPKAIELFLLKEIPLEESIKNPEKYGFHIYDYCKSNKINKQYEVFWNNQKVQNLNRYYFAKPAPYLLKRKTGKQTMDHVNVGQGVIIFNEFVEKNWEDYRIDYSYYTSKARRIIDTVTEDERQGSLF